MEPSKILGCKEECSSSVSGWTIYIGSPLPENDNYHEDDHSIYCQGEDCNIDKHEDDDDANAKSDDSMESDASSGPSHREFPGGSSEPSPDKHATSKLPSKEKLRKPKMKKDERRIKVARDEPESKAKGAATQARSGAKVRKAD